MKAKKMDVFKKVIGQAGMEKPADDFTAIVMDEVLAGVNNEVVINPALRSLLQQTHTATAPADITANVMAQIMPAPQQSYYRPVITKTAWYVIGGLTTLSIIMLGFLNGQAASAQNSVMGSRIANAIKHLNAVSPLYFMIVVLVCTLLLADYLLTQRQNRMTNIGGCIMRLP